MQRNYVPTIPNYRNHRLIRRLFAREIPLNPIILKARKYLCISPSSIPLLTSEKDRKLNQNTLQRLLSKYLKKNPFQKIAFGPKTKKLTVLANSAKK